MQNQIADAPVQDTVPKRPRRRSTRLFAAAAAAIVATAVLAGCISQDQQTVQNQINASRRASGLANLADYQTSDNIAQLWAEHLAQIGGIAHRPDITGGYQSGTWCRLGENVGMGPDLATLHTAFMNSAPHRANILGPYDHVGTGVAKSGNTYYVVHEFVDLC